jgi:hypothetical protein
MKVLDIITETQFDPRNLSHDQIMATLQEAFRRDPNALRGTFTAEEDARIGFFAQRRINAQAVEAAFAARWGGPLTNFFRIAGIAVPIYQWYTKMQALNELAKEKDENGQYKMSDADLVRQRNGITGIAVIAMIALPIMKGAIDGALGTALKGILQYCARAGGRAGGALIIISTIATAAGWLALKVWLQTPGGEAWLRSFIPELIINGIGWAANWGIDKFTGLVKDTTGVDISPDPDTKKRIDDIPDLSVPFDADKERAKMRAGAKVKGPEVRTDIDYNHNGQNY